MQKTHWNKLNAEISRLGFGCMRFPTTEDGKIDREKSKELIDYAYKNGVNYYDTAHYYHDGESQLFIGEALEKYPRESFYLATKLPLWDCETLQKAEDIFAIQLKNCRVDYFDFYLLHAVEKDKWQKTKELGILDKLIEYKNAGKIKQLGFSFHGDYDTFCEMLDYYSWDFVQIQINYIDDKLQDAGALYAKLLEKNIPCIIMEPVRGGFLANLPPEAEKKLAASGAAYSPAAWAIRWCQSLDNAKIILSGMSDMVHVKDNIETFSSAPPLSDSEKEMLADVRDFILSIQTVPCTHCGYCMDCSFGVNIPEVFTIYNKLELFKNSFSSKGEYKELGKEHAADNCTQCGKCKPMCPQGIDIPTQLLIAHEKLKIIEKEA